MVTERRAWPATVTLLLALLACLGPLVQPYSTKPEHPGKDASPEELKRYKISLRRYLNELTRQRYGKRDISDALLFKLLLTDPEDPVKSRPESPSMW